MSSRSRKLAWTGLNHSRQGACRFGVADFGVADLDVVTLMWPGEPADGEGVEVGPSPDSPLDPDGS